MARQLQVLLWNADPLKISHVKDFRPIDQKVLTTGKNI
jgi:hypothetical protein